MSTPSKSAILAIVTIAAMLAAGAGYWLGRQGAAAEGAPVAQVAGGKKLLYYRNPMGLPDTSPVPKKDAMGMDYLPVYEGEEAVNDAGIKVSADKVQKSGVKSAPVERRVVDRAARAVGRVELDERRVFAVAPRFEGWIERLHANVTGQPVARGQPLFEVYSPELVSAQREYALAARAAREAVDEAARAAMQKLAEASLRRLRNWDISEEQIARLAKGGEAAGKAGGDGGGISRTLTFRSPVAGVITEKKAVQGMRFMPGEALYQIADLGSIWVIADVAEQDIGLVRTGGRARVRIDAYPERSFEGRVAYVYPTMKAETRTIPVRLELANREGLLKPAMYAHVELVADDRPAALAVPPSAVIDSGRRQVVVVDLGEGRFESREVRTGARGDQFVEILDGVREGERVVVAGNFLIDSESNLNAALGGLGGTEKARTVGHRGVGRLVSIEGETLSIAHEPVASLKWPAMTMEFTVANSALLAGLKPGTPIAFEFVERKPGEWLVTKIEQK